MRKILLVATEEITQTNKANTTYKRKISTEQKRIVPVYLMCKITLILLKNTQVTKKKTVLLKKKLLSIYFTKIRAGLIFTLIILDSDLSL